MFCITTPLGNAQERTLFADDFESYVIGSRPSPPWEFWFNTNGAVITYTYVSPSKSLRLLGSMGWSCVAVRRFSSNSHVVGYEVYGKVESFGAPYTSLGVSFQKKTSPTTSIWIAAVQFGSDGLIRAGNKVLQPYQLNRWYKIKVLYYRDRMTYDVWIDGTLRASGVPDSYSNPYEIDGLGLVSDWAAVNCYFDDVKVFEVDNLYSLPANAILPNKSLIERALLRFVSPNQTIVASPGETISLSIGYQIWQGQNPNEIDQLLLIYSWTPSWPPPKGYYVGIYNDIPPSYPGTTGNVKVSITVPKMSGTYYLWLGWAAHYGIDQAASTFTQPLSLPAHIKVVVSAYSLSVDFVEAIVNGKQINSPDTTIDVGQGERIRGYLKVNVNNNRGGPWITPVIGTVSWGRVITGKDRGWFITLTDDAPTGKSTWTFSFDLVAPSSPGIHYLGIFAGWMYTGDEVASNDHPPNFGDGDDVWDMSATEWEKVLYYGADGPTYGQPGRAIRIRVSSISPSPVPILGIGNYYMGVNDIVTVDVVLMNGSSIAGGSFEVHYDPGIVIAIDVYNGDFGSPIYNLNNNAGVVKIAVAQPIGVGKDIVCMAKIAFKAVNVGYTSLDLQDVSLNDREGNIIKPLSKDGAISVGQWSRGDVNHNGNLDTGDATLVLRMVVGTWPQDLLGDMNNNGVIDTGDATLILRKVVGLDE